MVDRITKGEDDKEEKNRKTFIDGLRTPQKIIRKSLKLLV